MADFQTSAVNFISGSGNTDSIGPRPDVSLFNTAADGTSQTYVYVMHPCYDRSDELCPDKSEDRFPRYRNQIGMLRKTLMSTFPGLPRERIIEYYYRVSTTKPPKDPYPDNFSGRALFEFDPQGISGGNGQPDWRLLYEATSRNGSSIMGQLDLS